MNPETELDVSVGDRVRAMRVIQGNWSVSTVGEVTDIHDPCPVPGVQEPAVVVDDADEGEVPVRLSNVEKILEKAEDDS